MVRPRRLSRQTCFKLKTSMQNQSWPIKHGVIIAYIDVMGVIVIVLLLLLETSVCFFISVGVFPFIDGIGC